MKRTKAPGTQEPQSEQKKQETVYVKTQKRKKDKKSKTTTEDGRLLGELAENKVPKKFRNIVQDQKIRRNYSHEERYDRRIALLARTRLPLALEPDEEVNIVGKMTKVRGLSQARLNVLIAAFSEGMSQEKACTLAGISVSTFRNWIKKGENGEHPYSVICAAVKEADAILEQKLLKSLIEAGTVKEEYEESTVEYFVDSQGRETEKTKTIRKIKHPNWQASAWLLERKNVAFRLDKQEPVAATGNTGEEDLLFMDATTLGTAQTAEEFQQEQE